MLSAFLLSISLTVGQCGVDLRNPDLKDHGYKVVDIISSNENIEHIVAYNKKKELLYLIKRDKQKEDDEKNNCIVYVIPDMDYSELHEVFDFATDTMKTVFKRGPR